MDPPTPTVNNAFFSSTLLPTPSQTEQLLSFLQSNSSHPETVLPRIIIASSKADLERYDPEIWSLRNTLSRLVAERDALKQYQNRCSSVCAQVRRLPSEILVEIFARCAPDRLKLSKALYSRLAHESLPLLAQVHLLRVSQVCFSWNRLATGTPSLWITITADTIGSVPEDQIMNLSFQSLERSGQAPLTIAIHGWGLRTYPCLLLLAEHSDRSKSLSMYHGMGELCLPRTSGKLSLLEHLDIGFVDLAEVDVFESAPRLTYVSISAPRPTLPKLPWNQLLEFNCNARSLRRMEDYNESIFFWSLSVFNL